jgi:RNA polymerase sigma factor (sigma-70 family)
MEIRVTTIRGGEGIARKAVRQRIGEIAPDVEALYRLHWKDLCTWLRWRYGAGPPEPEDIAQAAFLKMAEVKDRSLIENPRAYLFTIAANTALMGIRAFVHTQQFIDRELEDTGARLEELSPERIHSSRERLNVVLGQMDLLSEKQRDIVTRNRIGGQTYEQISAETGWSLADISRQLTQALATMRQALQTYDGDDQEDTTQVGVSTR